MDTEPSGVLKLQSRGWMTMSEGGGREGGQRVAEQQQLCTSAEAGGEVRAPVHAAADLNHLHRHSHCWFKYLSLAYSLTRSSSLPPALSISSSLSLSLLLVTLVR